MPDILAIVIIGLGALLVVTGISGNYAEPFSLIGITLPGTESEQLAGTKTGQSGSTPPASSSNLPTGGNVLAGLGNQHITGV